MLALSRRRKVDWCLGKVQLATAGAVMAFGAVLKADQARFSGVPWLASAIGWMQDWAWFAVIVGPVVVVGVQWTRKRFGSPWAWEAIQKLIDEFRNEVFGDLTADPLDYHRVTLFKFHRIAPGACHPRHWRHWLIAVARSDHLTKLRIRRFRAPDDGDGCEGVVGRAWRCRDWVIVPSDGGSLPSLTSESSSEDIEAYAKETGVTANWVRKQLRQKRPLATSYAALMVRLKGQPWGVLVLDSRGAASIDIGKLDRFKAFGNLLTPLLERV